MVKYIGYILSISLILSLTTSVWAASDPRELAQRLENSARSGDERAAYKLGLLFSQGKQIDPDYLTAFQWFKYSAQQGYVKAMLKVADMCARGQGTKKDTGCVQEWHEKAAKAGSVEAMVFLGNMYHQQNKFKEAFPWYEKAAVLGSKAGQFAVGCYYYDANGIGFNLENAFLWWALAAKQDHAEAKGYLRHLEGKKGKGWADQQYAALEDRREPQIYWQERN